MKTVICLLTCLLVFCPRSALGAEDKPMSCYLQLVRGNDDATPPTPDAKPVGPVLDKKLRAVFKWQHFWELKREKVSLKTGEKVRRCMSAEREVELERTTAAQTTIRVFRNGKPTVVEKQAAEAPFSVIGGDKDGDQSWFIVVRRGEPQTPSND
jgi:hypothetical protein